LKLVLEDLNLHEHQRLVNCHKRKSPISEDDFVQLLEEDIDSQLKMMEKSSEKNFCAREDDITGELVGHLICLGYDASEQTKKNGAVDLTVKSEKYEWIAEAKRGTSNLNIFEGFLQLLTRYVKQDKNAGVLIYYQKPGAVKALKQFINYLNNKSWLNSKGIAKNEIALQYIEELFSRMEISAITDNSFSMKTDTLSGRSINIKVLCADFYFYPRDKSGRDAQRIKVENAKLALMNLHHSWKESSYEDFDIAALSQTLDLLYEFENGDYEL
jgi:hypothetical protein